MGFRIDHVQLAIPKGQDAVCRAFWGDTLGLKELPKPAELAKRGGVWFELDGAELHLGVEQDFSPAHKAHPCFLITGLDGIASALDAAGYRVEWDDLLKDRRRFFTTDPFGNRLEFMELRTP